MHPTASTGETLTGLAAGVMDHREKIQLRNAAFRATRLYPGPVGEVLSRELLAWEDFGYRLGGSAPIMRLVDHILATDLTTAGD